MWLVGELGLPHEHIPAGGDFGLNDTPEFLAMNPRGRVPVIDDDGTVVCFELISARYERRSLLITANQSFGEWGKIFPEPTTS
jgi:hypothetical protein